MGLHSLPGDKHGSRYFNRLRLGAPASLVLTHETRACLIDDISRTGTRLRVAPPLVKHQSLVLAFHELRVFATVMWLGDGECGLLFDEPLDLEDMQGMLWITENREMYERICREENAMDWADRLGG
jgi:PilZ domain